MPKTGMRRALRALVHALPLLALAAPAHAEDQRDPELPRYGSLGLDTGNMNRDVNPGDDFFDYMEGNWAEHTSIPPDKVSIGYNYDLGDKAEEDIKAIVDDAVAHPDTPAAQRIAAIWTAYMDEAGINAAGFGSLQPMIARVVAIKTPRELMELMAEPGYASAIDMGFLPDSKDPTKYALYATQGGLGLPAREYYLETGDKYDSIRKAYVAYIAQIFTLAGIGQGDDRAAAILKLETAIAKDDWTPQQMRDPKAMYNPTARARLGSAVPGFAWDTVLAKIGLPQAKVVVLGQPSALRAIAQHLTKDSVELWKDWLVFRLISDHADMLPTQFDAAHFAFYGTTLSGQTQQRPRWKRAIRKLDHYVGEDIGQIYLKTHWSPEADKQMGEMLDDLRGAYGDLIGKAAWMDTATRTAALAKLATFEPRVAGPKTFIDYSDLKVRPDDAVGNAVEAERFEWALQVKRYPLPVDRGLWEMHPQTVNAYYDPLTNQVTFPAAELQPPFFDPNADPAVNYGAAGATIGHEMGHGFDDEGRQFDAKGRLANWWTPASLKAFNAHASMLIDQFNAYEPVPGVHVKGDLTLGENLADLGGLEAAYAAYHRYLARHGEAPELDGMIGDQRFFLSYAQSWQGQTRDDALRQQLLGDPHSPDKLRVNGIVRNIDAWYAAFDVKPEAKLYLPPEQRVHLWTASQ